MMIHHLSIISNLNKRWVLCPNLAQFCPNNLIYIDAKHDPQHSFSQFLKYEMFYSVLTIYRERLRRVVWELLTYFEE